MNMDAKKILVCDDDESIVELLGFILETSNEVAVIGEVDSRVAYKRILTEKPELVILDLQMPMVTGDEIVQQLRANPETTALPVMVISANRDGRQVALAAGADSYLAKPFDVEDVLQEVNKFLYLGGSGNQGGNSINALS